MISTCFCTHITFGSFSLKSVTTEVQSSDTDATHVDLQQHIPSNKIISKNCGIIILIFNRNSYKNSEFKVFMKCLKYKSCENLHMQK